MKKYISLGVITVVMLAMLVTVFVFDIIIHPLAWVGIVIMLAISTVMYYCMNLKNSKRSRADYFE